MIIEDQKMHCVHEFITNQESKAVNKKIRNSLSITFTDSLHFESDKMNDWMLEAKLEPKKWAN